MYLLADVIATYGLGHMSSVMSKKSSGEHQLVAFWAPFLLLHLGGQDTITAYALEDNELWRRHLLNMFVQVAGTAYVLYKYINSGEATFVRAAMLILAAGVFKYGERIWALKLASKGDAPHRPFLLVIYYSFLSVRAIRKLIEEDCFTMDIRKLIEANGGDCFTKNKQFRSYAYIVMTAHALRHVLVKPLIIDRNEASIDWHEESRDRSYRPIDLATGLVQGFPWQDDESEDASAKEKRTLKELYKGVEVQLGLMYDMLYTKAEVIHKSRGHLIRAISVVSCFAALVVFTKSKRYGYSTLNIVISFALLGGACALEVTSFFKAIGSTWTYALLRRYRLHWLANAVLFARYYLIVVKDGRWSNSVGQFNLISFCVHIRKSGLMGRIAHLFGVSDFWYKARCTKHPKLSPVLKEFVWGFLRGDKSDMVQIEDVATQSGYWARKFSGFAQSEQLDWSMSCEFQKSVLIWHIATSIFLNHLDVKRELVDKDMVASVSTISDYMMYLFVEHPNILASKANARSLFHHTCKRLISCIDYHQTVDEAYQRILDYKEIKHLPEESEEDYDRMSSVPDDYPGDVVLEKSGKLARILLDMELGALGVRYKMVMIGTVWTEMLCYTATNASDGFHARQLSNGGEFLTHILLLTKYAAAVKTVDETVEARAVDHAKLTVDDG